MPRRAKQTSANGNINRNISQLVNRQKGLAANEREEEAIIISVERCVRKSFQMKGQWIAINLHFPSFH